ncbi:hypothetical protein ID866_8928, partial [Astraeus odoratus]
MLHLLPAEIAVQTVAYLPLQSLHNVSLVSHGWHDLIIVNENTVYRNAAILHRFARGAQLLPCSDQDFPVADWKSFCRRQIEIEKAWRGKAPTLVKELSESGSGVHRIKVDEENGFVIATGQKGGLTVTDLSDNNVLWSLSPSHVVDYAHCEYDRGYIVFNRSDNCKEVWRHALDVNDNECSTESPPDKQMNQAWCEATLQWPPPTRRGHFRPWALVRIPEISRAFRFSYPTLLAASEGNAYLWHVPQGRLVETIRNIQRVRDNDDLGRICYVEVNDKYAFICGTKQLRIFERQGGALVYHLSPKCLPPKALQVLHSDGGAGSTLFATPQELSNRHVKTVDDGCFLAVHVSGDGRDIALLTSSGILALIPAFQRLISGEAKVSDIAVQINFQLHKLIIPDVSIYLAMSERDGKVAVATRRGLFLVSPDIDFSRFDAERPAYPGVVVTRLSMFDEKRFRSYITCLQITRTGVYFNWKPSKRGDWVDEDAFPWMVVGELHPGDVHIHHNHVDVADAGDLGGIEDEQGDDENAQEILEFLNGAQEAFGPPASDPDEQEALPVDNPNDGGESLMNQIAAIVEEGVGVAMQVLLDECLPSAVYLVLMAIEQ